MVISLANLPLWSSSQLLGPRKSQATPTPPPPRPSQSSWLVFLPVRLRRCFLLVRPSLDFLSVGPNFLSGLLPDFSCPQSLTVPFFFRFLVRAWREAVREDSLEGRGGGAGCTRVEKLVSKRNITRKVS